MGKPTGFMEWDRQTPEKREIAARVKDSREFVLPLAVALFRATGPAMNIAVGIYLGTLLGVPMPFEAIAAAVLVSPLVSIGSPSLPNSISFVSSFTRTLYRAML